MTRRGLPPLLALAALAGCGLIDSSSSNVTARAVESLDAIEARLASWEADPTLATPEAVAELREAVESHGDALISEQFTERLDKIAAILASIPVPIAYQPVVRIGAELVAALGLVARLLNRRKPI